jgi:asparagine synthase (glutamine-hydrolysing)
MSSEFFAILWNAASAAEVDAAARINAELARSSERWVSSLSMSGFRFHASGSGAARPSLYPLTHGAGLVFGTLFSRRQDDAKTACSRCVAFDDDDAARIVRSKGRHLVDYYWGHYVAFVIDDDHRTSYVLRSPACHQPCLCATYRGVRMYFSAAEDLAALGLLRLTVNWDFVTAFCAYTRLSGAETGLAEISELSAGEYHEITPGTYIRGYHWSAAEIARRQLAEDPTESTRRLRATVLSCVSTWAARYPSIVQRLSGGLDSSILTACLRLAPERSKVLCLNYYSRGTYGDERQYARAVSSAAGFPLVEYRHESTRSMDRLLGFPRTHSPAAYLTRDGSDHREIELAHDVDASARFTGIMGDVLFHMPPAAASVADYARAHRFQGRLIEIALQAAQIDRVSVWKILRWAVMDGLFKPPESFVPGDFGRPDQALLTPSASESVFHANPLRFAHPWLHDLREVPVGKFPLVAALSWNSTYFNALPDPLESELIHPYYSEPLMELCLRLPTYVMLRDGWDRALARQAFERELPEIIRTRTSKGSANLHLRERIEHNQTFIRDLLADGVLVQQGIVDRKKLLDCLPGRTTRSTVPLGRLWACVAAEAWSRAWLSQPGRALNG